jgi:hypothetical protein
MEKISWIDRVRNEEVLHKVKEKRNVLRTIKRRKANCIGHTLHRNCVLKHINEEKIEGQMWREDEEEEASRYYMTFRKLQNTGNWNRKHQIAQCGELAFKKSMELS